MIFGYTMFGETTVVLGYCVIRAPGLQVNLQVYLINYLNRFYLLRNALVVCLTYFRYMSVIEMA